MRIAGRSFVFNTQISKNESFMLKPSQCRAARALLDWTQRDVAERTSISAVSIRAFEKGGDMRESNLRLLRLTFEAAGILFQADGEVTAGGIGVRLRSSSDDA
ncbi:XRE family transcriptional regulator [Rhizobium ruizarguesonis]|nr:XRE family transcriptional regulator [Rhizobium ruizarguesonis]